MKFLDEKLWQRDVAERRVFLARDFATWAAYLTLDETRHESHDWIESGVMFFRQQLQYSGFVVDPPSDPGDMFEARAAVDLFCVLLEEIASHGIHGQHSEGVWKTLREFPLYGYNVKITLREPFPFELDGRALDARIRREAKSLGFTAKKQDELWDFLDGSGKLVAGGLRELDGWDFLSFAQEGRLP